jgi:hypothetical protein
MTATTADGVNEPRENDWDGARRLLNQSHARARGHQHIWRQSNQFRCKRTKAVAIGGTRSYVDRNVTTVGPAKLLQALHESRCAQMHCLIVSVEWDQYTNAPHSPARLLRPRHQRPRRRTTEPCDEVSAFDHSITSSARNNIDCGTVRPSALAVLRFTTISYFTGNCTGRSPGIDRHERG